MRKAAWAYCGAESQAWEDGGIALFRTTGVVSQAVAGSVLGDCQGAMRRWQTAGLIAEYDRADLRIDPETLLDSALHVIRHGSGELALPTALVVRLDDRQLWLTYAKLMAQAGVLRGVFTNIDDASRWVRRQAAVYAEDRLRTPASGR